MPNMSYCRFQNTRGDLIDCAAALQELFHGESSMSPEELEAAKAVIKTAIEIVKMVADEAPILVNGKPLTHFLIDHSQVEGKIVRALKTANDAILEGEAEQEGR